MAEATAFSRRRHAADDPEPAAATHYAYDTAAAAAAHYRDRLAASVDVVTVDTSAPRSHSKNRRGPAAPAAPTSPRKVSGSQMRFFFLLCVAVYFATIFFANDIVAFAEWMSDDDPVAKWMPARETTKEQVRTADASTQPTAAENRNAGNLRGREEHGGDTKLEAEDASAPPAENKMLEVVDSRTPAVAEQATKPVENNSVETGATTSAPLPANPVVATAEPNMEELDPQENKKEPHENGKETDGEKTAEEKTTEQVEEKPSDQGQEKPSEREEEVVVEEDAPLDSVDGKAAPAETPVPSLVMDAPAEIPKLVEPVHVDALGPETAAPAADDGAQDPEVVS